MTIKQFIKSAIEGGWLLKDVDVSEKEIQPCLEDVWKIQIFGSQRNPDPIKWGTYHFTIHRIVLDPETWKAVGKVKGWPEGIECELAMRMIHFLFKGMSLEEYIATL